MRYVLGFDSHASRESSVRHSDIACTIAFENHFARSCVVPK